MEASFASEASRRVIMDRPASYGRSHNAFASSATKAPRNKSGLPGEPDLTPALPPKRNMILTNCAACAAPLAHNAPRCVRCKVRYCDRKCQMDHWPRGHKQICAEIHRGGNAEQYHADKKYKEAVAEAVEACADDTMMRSFSPRATADEIDRGPREPLLQAV